MNNLIYVVPDTHARDFYKPVLEIKDSPIVFLGDYMDPYYWEGFSDEEGIEKTREIFDFARNNKNVTLLAGNHDASWIWSHLGFERTHQENYKELHKLYRENIDLLHPIHKVGSTIFTHAGINSGWVNVMNSRFKEEGRNFQLTQETIIPYIENEWALELQSDQAPIQHFSYCSLNSPIFDIGRSRGGDAPYGGPFWSDFYYDYWYHPEGWNIFQIVGHQQGEVTGLARFGDGIVCLDCRAIFEYDPETQIVKPSEINDEETKAKIPEKAWEGERIRFTENYWKSDETSDWDSPNKSAQE